MVDRFWLDEYFVGEVGEWGEWSACSVSCDGGTKTRSRDCIKDFVWQICEEELEGEDVCATEPCSSKSKV